MKKILYYFLAIGSLLASTQIASAQGDHSIEKVIGNLTFRNEKPPKIDPVTLVGQRKSVSEPQTDGTYWIKIEAFTTGNAEIVTKAVPSDIVLVLDLSTSMRERRGDQTQQRNKAISYNDVVNAREAGVNYIYNGNQVFGEHSNNQYRLYTNQGGNNTRDYLGNAVTTPTAPIYTSPNNNSSQLYTGSSRIFELKHAVDAFITTIKEKDLQGEGGTSIGNRIAIITYEDDPQIVQNFAYINDLSVDELKKTVWDFYLQRGTQPGKAFVEANDQFKNYPRASDQVLGRDYTRTVVFFTDGEPYDHDGLVDSEGRADASGTKPPKYVAIDRAYITKNTYNANVYSVGMFSSTIAEGSATWKYLNYVSSNYPLAVIASGTGAGSTSENQMQPGAEPYKTGFYFDASNSDLTKIFTSIAEQEGGSTNKNLSAASSNVDIVTSSFTVNNASGKDVHVFTSKCTGATGTGANMQFTWAEEIEATFSEDKYPIYEDGIFVREEDVDNAITKTTSGNVITVTGFDYSNNWCGTVTDGDETTVRGHKIMILIPVKMSTDAVGGPDVATNTEDSGIYLPGQTPGVDDPVVSFDVPHISLPLNIWIKKKGLNVGESARFVIQRTTTPNDAESWEDVTTVFVTHQMAAGSTDEPMVKVKGLPATNASDAPFTYRVVEDEWDWSYTLKDITDMEGTSIREGTSRFAYTYKLINNPFVFENEKKTDVIRHAESKATNTFKTGSAVIYDDSKKNTGEGRPTTTE